MRQSMKTNSQQGFTLIELIVVIVILGILAAVALPRYTSLQANARYSALQGLQGGLNSAVALAHAQALVQGTAAAATGTITMEGVSVNMVYGYPDATAAGIGAAMNGNLSNWTVVAGPPLAIYSIGGNASCEVTYTAATNATTPPVVVTVPAAGAAQAAIVTACS